MLTFPSTVRIFLCKEPVDLRKAYIAYLQNNNAQLRVDGTLFFKPAGVLTYDGVHPSASGTELLANLIGDGILRALSKR